MNTHLRYEGKLIRFDRNCQSPLDELPQVSGEGPRDHTITMAIVGEAPGMEESLSNRPFVGPSGKTLSWALSNAEIYRPRLWLTNVLDRQPPSNDITHVNAIQSIQDQTPEFRDEIRYVQTRGLKTILLLGNTASQAFGLRAPISQIRGSIYVFDTHEWTVVDTLQDAQNPLFIIPTYHPSYIMRMRWSFGGRGTADYAAVWIDDFRKAKSITTTNWTPPQEHFNLVPTEDQVHDFVNHAVQSKALIACDIETTSIDPANGQIVVIGLAHDAEHALVVPFLGYEGIPYWSHNQLISINRALNRLFTECPLMFQNAFFDVPYLRYHGYSIPLDAVQHDTLLLHHTISPELTHNLGFIVSQYGDTPYWKDEFSNRETTILRMDQKTLRQYNARDCVVLHQILPRMLDDIQELDTLSTYQNEAIPLIEPVLEMMATGIRLDTKRLHELQTQFEHKAHELETQLRRLGNLPPQFNMSSHDDLRLFLFGLASSKYAKASTYATKKEGTKVRQELEDLHIVRTQTVPIYQPSGFRGRRTKNNTITLDKQGRLSYQRHLQNRLHEISLFKRPNEKHTHELESIRKVNEWLSLYNKWSSLTKVLTTYFSYVPENDGRIHTRFIAHGTATGRLASRSPNLQNVPARDYPELRSVFIAEDDYSLVAADYSNLEVKVMAYETMDPALIDIVDGGKNLHDINTQTLFHLEPTDPQWKAARRAAKIFQFGSLAYGGSDNEIYEKIILEVPDLNLTFANFKQIKQRYMDAHPIYVQWRNRIEAEVLQKRQIRTAFGRTRTFYGNQRDIVKEALNTPIQSGAASIVNRAMRRIWEQLHQSHLEARLCLQIHDEIIVECPDPELDHVSQILRTEMERPVPMYGIPRTFQIDLKIGKTWADLKD